MIQGLTILAGDCRETLKALPDKSVHCVVTSPPYWLLRNYGVEGQIGLEKTLAQYLAEMVAVFAQVHRVLRDDGTCWVNMGDGYAGFWGEKYAHKPFGADRTADSSTPPNKSTPDWKTIGVKPKDLIGIPWRLAFALQEFGWYLRSDIIWHKPNPMPESVTDRPTKAHEYIFLLSKFPRYFYDAEAIKDPSVEMNWESRYARSSMKSSPTEQRNGIRNGRGGVNAFRGQGHFRTGAGPANRDGREMKNIGVGSSRNKRSVWTVTTAPFNGAKLVADYVGDDGKPYKASPDCPLHGHLARSRTTGIPADGELPKGILRHTSDNGDGHGRESFSESKPTTCHIREEESGGNVRQQTPENNYGSKTSDGQTERILPSQNPDRNASKPTPDAISDCKTDSVCRVCSAPASGHSMEKNKTRHATSAVSHGSVSAKTPSGTSSIEPDAAQSGSVGHMTESNTLADETLGVSGLSEQTDFRSEDTQIDASQEGLKCNCELSSIDHFATFPPELIRPCILAGTSAHGCCPDCGAPFVRVVRKGEPDREHQRACGADVNGEYNGKATKDFATARAQDASATKARILAGMLTRETIGWKATCEHGAAPVPCVVLDPFGGAFTTAYVALQEGRRAIMCELNEEYIKIGTARCENIQPVKPKRAKKPVNPKQLSLIAA